jgi:hypothetical protein
MRFLIRHMMNPRMRGKKENHEIYHPGSFFPAAKSFGDILNEFRSRKICSLWCG